MPSIIAHLRILQRQRLSSHRGGAWSQEGDDDAVADGATQPARRARQSRSVGVPPASTSSAICRRGGSRRARISSRVESDRGRRTRASARRRRAASPPGRRHEFEVAARKTASMTARSSTLRCSSRLQPTALVRVVRDARVVAEERQQRRESFGRQHRSLGRHGGSSGVPQKRRRNSASSVCRARSDCAAQVARDKFSIAAPATAPDHAVSLSDFRASRSSR